MQEHEVWIDKKIREKEIVEYNYYGFKNLKMIGSGAYSSVYRAINKENTDEVFALKEIENKEEISKEIVNELKNMLSIKHHKNIIKFYGIAKFEDFKDENRIKYVLVLEYADSGTLSEYLLKNAKKIEWELKIQFAAQLVDAIKWLHDSDIVHGDLAFLPSKIMEGLREKPIQGIEQGYITIYEKCWQSNPNDRPSISMVSLMLNVIIYPPFQDIPIVGIDNDESDFEERTKEYIKYINTIFDEPSRITFDDQDSKTIFINELYSNLNQMLNKGESVPRTIKNYISKNGKSANDVLIWLHLKNEPRYICFRGIFYMWKIGTKEKEKNTDDFSLFLDAANGNEIIAMYFVGRCYEVGWNTKKNIKEAIKWYDNAINNGCTAAEWKLGDYYYRCQEYSKAFKLFRSAADKGNIVAMYNLGLCYRKGHGTYEDMNEGFKYLKQAAEMGVPNSTYELARCYEYGKGTTRNLHKASEWYQKATESGLDCRSYREQVTARIKREISESKC
ncbi:1243_t:CDS:2 [Dentiscutata heterogama]|uniref:1243_t:CDS:1 n=1 Tax=Dentiscutata heterogama TaxID=1316150 RepID=A0ACA9L6Y8_9GLOM|nr:1243_t:CDS:2 [Dentiscutata heterogama]